MSSFGRIFRVTTYGESHGRGVGCIVEGVSSGFTIDIDKIQYHLDRRKPGQSSITTQRSEKDTAVIMSGVQNGITLGTPICINIANADVKPSDYSQFREFPRPGHADFTYRMKYGIGAESGGGRASARETAARVAAGAIALEYLEKRYGISIIAWVESVNKIKMNESIEVNNRQQVDNLGIVEIMTDIDGLTFYRNSQGKIINDQDEEVEYCEDKMRDKEIANSRCPDPDAALKMVKKIRETKLQGDSLGGVIRCRCYNVPPGLGEPCFDKLEALLAHAMLSIPSTKGFSMGSGFEGTEMLGSEHNDPFQITDSGLRPLSNHAGGTLGGISSGAVLDFKVAFKPVSTISKPQPTSN